MKLNKFAVVISGVAFSLGMASMASATSTGTITFTGEVTDTTCEVSVNGDGADATVTLPTVPATELKTTGLTTGRTNFDLQLSNCSVGANGANTVSAYFQTGSTVDTTSGRLKQTDTSGAQNVSLQLRDGTNSNVIFVGSSTQQSTNYYANIASATSVTLPYSVEYYAEDAATAGAVSSSVVYNLQYK